MNTQSYHETFNRAVQMADQSGLDVGIEKMNEFGRTVYSVFYLPRPENRSGRELRCEVVRPGTPLSH